VLARFGTCNRLHDGLPCGRLSDWATLWLSAAGRLFCLPGRAGLGEPGEGYSCQLAPLPPARLQWLNASYISKPRYVELRTLSFGFFRVFHNSRSTYRRNNIIEPTNRHAR
jgi:hypothetical protein